MSLVPEFKPSATPRNILQRFAESSGAPTVDALWDRATPLERHIWVWGMLEITGGQPPRNSRALQWIEEHS